MAQKKPYFPNNWKRYKALDDEFFEPHSFDEVMMWKVAGWELPSDVYCIIRTTNLTTRKVKEYVYKQPKSAHSRIAQFRNDLRLETTVTFQDHQMYSGPNPNYEEKIDEQYDF